MAKELRPFPDARPRLQSQSILHLQSCSRYDVPEPRNGGCFKRSARSASSTRFHVYLVSPPLRYRRSFLVVIFLFSICALLLPGGLVVDCFSTVFLPLPVSVNRRDHPWPGSIPFFSLRASLPCQGRFVFSIKETSLSPLYVFRNDGGWFSLTWPLPERLMSCYIVSVFHTNRN